MREKINFRRLHGILLLDKPQGLSSNTALQIARRLFRAEKGGHTGALDPLATGLLPLCFGEATKIAGLLLGAGKAYRATVRLGATTDTDDAEGQVLRTRPVPALTNAQLIEALAGFVGTLSQRAPIYSALKQGGEPLYLKARRGDAIEAPVREVTVHSIELMEYTDGLLTFEVVCGSGTYIRSIARDLGEVLGCGGHITALRRLWVEPFSEPVMYTLEQLRQCLTDNGEEGLESLLLPIQSGLVLYPEIHLDEGSSARFNMGQRQRNADWPRGDVVVFDDVGRTIGMGRVSDEGVLSSQRVFNP